MNIIIELIIKIFVLLFEKDAERRKANRAPQEPILTGDEPPDHRAVLEAHFREMHGLYQPPAVPTSKRQNQALVGERPRPVPPPILEEEPPKTTATPHLVTLPGKNPLEQMILAGVILGPCKAHLNNPVRRGRREVL